MRIAYVTIHVAPKIMQGGVGNKIKTQMRIWREHGHEVTLFSLTPAVIPFVNEQQFIFGVKTNLLKREINRVSGLKRMLTEIQVYKPDTIYLRFGLYSYPLHQLFKIAPVVLEINSDDRQEYKKRSMFFYWMNRLTRNLIFDFASGIIFPSYELADILLPKRNKLFCVISNGIDLSQSEVLPPTRNKQPIITMVCSPGMDWHGVDKLIQLAKIYPDLQINIVGYSSKDIEGTVPKNVNLHGFLHKESLLRILAETDVACGTLALHRKNMEEACPLKVREALAYGVPLILGYKDTDLENIRVETILRIPNSEDNIITHAEQIHQFAYDMIGKRVNLDIVLPHLDQQKKEISRLDFFQKVITQCK